MKTLMGHMSAVMIERYSHIREQAKRAAVEALSLSSKPSNWFGGSNNPTKCKRKRQSSEM